MSDVDPIIPHRLLDLAPGVGQRAETFQFELLDRGFHHLGWVKPKRNEPVGMRVDTRARVFRTLSGVELREEDARNVNTLRDLLKVWHVLEDGTRNPLGVYEFDDSHEMQHSQESSHAVDLFDLMSTLDDAVPYPVSIPRGSALRPYAISLIESYGITHHRVSEFSETAGDHLNWPAGESGLTILRKLFTLANQLPPYFANDGYLVGRPAPPMVPGVGHRYDGNTARTLPEQTVLNRQLGKAKNAFLVIGVGGQATDVSAVAYVDPELEHSKENRGRTLTEVIHEQGLETSAQCYALARTFAKQDPRQYATARFASVIDSRHDHFDLVDFLDDTWLEVVHAATLEPGGSHTHEVVKRLEVQSA